MQRERKRETEMTQGRVTETTEQMKERKEKETGWTA